MTGPYPGQTYISVGAANPLTGQEIVPLLQSGRNKYTTASAIAALGGGGGGGGSGTVTQIDAGFGLAGGPITSSGTLYVVVGDGLAISGNAIVNTSGNGLVQSVFTRTGAVTAVSGDYFSAQVTESGNLYFTSARVNALIPVSSVFSRTGAVTAASGDYSFAQISSSLNLGTQVTGNLPFVNIQSASPTVLLGNPTGATATPSQITLGAGIGFSGTTLINLSGGADGVVQISSGSGLTGGPITSSGSLSVVLGSGLAFSGNSIIAVSGGSGVGTVVQISTGTGLTGGPITSSGSIAFATIAPSSLWANVSTATNTPVVTTLGAGLAFSGTTIVNTSGAADGVTSITFQSGLSGATITGTGTVGISNNGVTNAMIRQGGASTLVGNPTTATANVQDITVGGALVFSGTILTTTGLTTGTVVSIATSTGLTGGTITNTGTISFASIAPSSLWSNVSTATAVPVVTTLGAGLGFSGTTIVNLSGAADGVVQISTGTGLTGGPVTSSGTITLSASLNNLSNVVTSGSTSGDFFVFNGTTWSNRNADAIDVRTFGAFPDAKTVSDIRTTSGGATVTSAAGLFVSTDTGKSIKIYNIQNEAAVFRGTISSITNSTVAVLSAATNYTSVSGDAIAYWGTDSWSGIQSALTYADSLVPGNYNGANFPVGSGYIKVVFPADSRGAGYIFTSGFTVGRNVILEAEAMLFNNAGSGSTDRNWAFNGTGYHINRLLMECGGGMGVNIGTSSTQNSSNIDNLQLWNVGPSYSGSLSPASQTALRLVGYDFTIGRFWSKGGNIGVNLDAASDIFVGTPLEIIAAVTSVVAAGVENAHVEWVSDTGSLISAAIDATHNSRFIGRAFSVTNTQLTTGVQLGGYSTTPNRGLYVDYMAQRTGGKACFIANTEDTTVNLQLSNAALYTASGGDITLGVEYGTSNTGTILINMNRDSNIAASYSGTPYGQLADKSDNSTVFIQQQNVSTATLTDTGTIAWNLASGQVAKVTLAGNRVLGNPTNPIDGGTYILRVIQGTTGNFTLTYSSSYKWPSGVAPVLSTTGNAVDVLTFHSDGTSLFGVAQKNFT